MPLLSPGENAAGGFGQGLMSGVQTFLQARQQQADNQRSNAALGLMAAKQGYDYNPQTGTTSINDYGNAIKNAQTSGIALQQKQQEESLKNLNEANDPESDTSNAVRSLGKAYMGALRGSTAYKKNPKNFSDIEDTLTSDDSSAHDINQIANHPLLKSMVSEVMGQDKTDAKLAQIQGTIDRMTAGNRAKDAATVSTLSAKMQKDLDPDAARAGNFGQISNTFIQSQKLKKLATDAQGNLANLTSVNQEELALGMAKMLGGSAGGSDSQIKNLVPASAVGNVQKLKSWLLNDPQGLDQQAFTSKMLETINREADLAHDQMKGIQVQRLGAHRRLKEMDPDAYGEILDRYGVTDTGPKGLLNAPQKSGPGFSEGQTATGPNGQKVIFKGGQWQAM